MYGICTCLSLSTDCTTLSVSLRSAIVCLRNVSIHLLSSQVLCLSFVATNACSSAESISPLVDGILAAATFRFHPQSGVNRALQVQGILIDQLAVEETLHINRTCPKTSNIGIVITKWAYDIGLEPKVDESFPNSGVWDFEGDGLCFTGESMSEAFKVTLRRGYDPQSHPSFDDALSAKRNSL